MDKWFTIDQIDEGTYIISEYRHWDALLSVKWIQPQLID